LRGVIGEWELEFESIAIVTDNASDVTTAVKNLNVGHLPRFAHMLNLVVQQAVSQLKA
jgi:hypothetical protein